MRYRFDVMITGMRTPGRLPAMAACFLLFVSSGCERYEQKDGKIYYRESSGGMQTTPVLVPQADPDTFRTLRHKYARDRHHVYYRGKVVQGAQPGYIRVLAPAYARDRRSAYCAAQSIPGADPRTFRLIGGEGYATDGTRIYWCTTTLPGAHLPSFRLLQHHSPAAIDRAAVYHGGQRVDICRRATFREIDAEWQIDGQCVYRYLERQPQIDAATFQVLGKMYVRDRSRIYTVDVLSGVVVAVEGADPATFRELADASNHGYPYGRDASGCYANQRRVACSVFRANP